MSHIKRPAWPSMVASALLVAAGFGCAGLNSPGAPTPVELRVPGTLALTEDEALYRSPTWSPDGGFIAALRSTVYPPPRGPISEGDVVIFDLASGERQVILAPPTVKPESARDRIFWLPGAQAIAFYYYNYADQQEVPYLVIYDRKSGETTSTNLCPCWPIALNPQGTELLINNSPDGAFQLSWLNLSTGEMRTEVSLDRSEPREHQYFVFSLSPDGRTLLFDDLHGNVLRYEVGSGAPPTPFLSEAASPAWSPDGSKLVYSQLRRRGTSTLDYYDGELVIASREGSSPERLFPETLPAGMLSPAWSPDGNQIAFLYGSRHSNALLIAEVPERLRP